MTKPKPQRRTKRQTYEDESMLARFRDALRTARQKKGWSQGDLAKLIGRSQAAVAGWENGPNTPPVPTTFAIERALELAPGALSQHLGFMPVSAAGARPPAVPVDEAIMRAADLDDVGRKGLIAAYLAMRSPRARLARRKSAN